MPPELRHHVISGDELDLLYRRPEFQARLAACLQVREPSPQGQMHETFCCTKEKIIYREPGTDDDVVVMSEQTRKHVPGKSVIILLLCDGDDVYHRRIP